MTPAKKSPANNGGKKWKGTKDYIITFTPAFYVTQNSCTSHNYYKWLYIQITNPHYLGQQITNTSNHQHSLTLKSTLDSAQLVWSPGDKYVVGSHGETHVQHRVPFPYFSTSANWKFCHPPSSVQGRHNVLLFLKDFFFYYFLFCSFLFVCLTNVACAKIQYNLRYSLNGSLKRTAHPMATRTAVIVH